MPLKEKDISEMTCHELAAALREAQQEILDLHSHLEEYEWIEVALRKRTTELSERVKELECLHAITHCLCRPKGGLVEMLKSVVDLLPNGYQQPANTWVCLQVTGQTFHSPDFQTTHDSHSADILIHGVTAGIARVYVKRQTDPNTAPPILPTEKALLKTVSLWIGKILEYAHESHEVQTSAHKWTRLLR